MRELMVDLGDRSYPIYIGRSVLKSEKAAQYLDHKQILLVTNETIYGLYSELIAELVPNSEQVLILKDGETYKNQDSLFEILTRLLELQFTRQARLIAFGGGVIGDLVGFAASIYQRGIDFVQIPTTLLAQVDSSVGGKTAINHPLGKNMIGAFHQPIAVLIDPTLLETLPEREYASGLAEVIKYGFIQDEPFLNWIEESSAKILALESDVVGEMIYRSCDAKREIVRLDERESGVRATLNLGHTFGHALEQAYRYQGLLHGEAVSIGIVMASYLSWQIGLLSESDFKRVESLLSRLNLPIRSEKFFEPEALLSAMRLDKKNSDKKIRLVLLRALGEAYITDQIAESEIIKALEYGMK